jgi:hypothetical protein
MSLTSSSGLIQTDSMASRNCSSTSASSSRSESSYRSKDVVTGAGRRASGTLEARVICVIAAEGRGVLERIIASCKSTDAVIDLAGGARADEGLPDTMVVSRDLVRPEDGGGGSRSGVEVHTSGENTSGPNIAKNDGRILRFFPSSLL